jgi:hypothetical protein
MHSAQESFASRVSIHLTQAVAANAWGGCLNAAVWAACASCTLIAPTHAMPVQSWWFPPLMSGYIQGCREARAPSTQITLGATVIPASFDRHCMPPFTSARADFIYGCDERAACTAVVRSAHQLCARSYQRCTAAAAMRVRSVAAVLPFVAGDRHPSCLWSGHVVSANSRLIRLCTCSAVDFWR